MNRTWLTVSLVLLAGCSGERGPDGINGKDGEDGEDGAQGPTGPAGPQGPKGDTGEAGAGYQPRFLAACFATLDLIGAGGNLGSDGIGETGLEYSVVRFSNDDLEVTCEAGLGAAEASADGNYYPATTNGSVTGVCTAGQDYPPSPDGTAGYWRFTADSELGPRATYVDAPTHPMNGDFIEFESDDCVVKTMAKDGKWSNSSLGDMF